MVSYIGNIHCYQIAVTKEDVKEIQPEILILPITVAVIESSEMPLTFIIRLLSVYNE